MEERAKTKSKHFYDDEILFVYPNGDIHLKDEVRRMKPINNEWKEVDNYENPSHINEIDLLVQKRRRRKEEQTSEYEGSVSEY